MNPQMMNNPAFLYQLMMMRNDPAWMGWNPGQPVSRPADPSLMPPRGQPAWMGLSSGYSQFGPQRDRGRMAGQPMPKRTMPWLEMLRGTSPRRGPWSSSPGGPSPVPMPMPPQQRSGWGNLTY